MSSINKKKYKKRGSTALEIYSARDLPHELKELLEHYQHLFKPPTELPQILHNDHKIHLLLRIKPVNVSPYRYPYFQTNEIEKLVAKSLEQGIIKSSQSPFLSLVLLVKKKNGSFTFCVDYRALNDVTVRDNFFIPTIDELFDELRGVMIFTRLDLRGGYHQTRFHSRDVYKITFRTHEGHYEFLVMPFCLRNATSTFQVTMNLRLAPFLQKI